MRIAADMVNEGLTDTRTAIKMVEPQHLDQLLHPQVSQIILLKDFKFIGPKSGVKVLR